MTGDANVDYQQARRVLVCGSRDWLDRANIESVLLGQVKRDGRFSLVHGAARGADRLAADVARCMGLDVEPFPAAWPEHHPDWCPGAWCQRRSFCVGAGPRRNQQMLDSGPFDCAYAFKDGFDHTFTKGGTEDMVKRCAQAGVYVQVAEHAPWGGLSFVTVEWAGA